MTEIITQNPIVALILIIVPVAAVMWKIFHELYVKPRDFRIDLLKEDMARLSSQLEDFRNPRVRVISGESNADVSSPIEAVPTDTKPHAKAPLPIAQSNQGSKTTGDRIEARSTDSKLPEEGPLLIVQSSEGSKTPADSLAAFYERWSDPSITKLQKQKFERDWTGKDVRWVVSVDSVGEASHGNILVSVRDGARDDFSAPRAILVFSERDAEVLLSLRSGDPIVVTGKVREFFLGPMLDGLTVDRA